MAHKLDDGTSIGYMEQRHFNHFYFHGNNDPHYAAEEEKCLRSTEDIKRGQFVGSYVGELITSQEALMRRDAASSFSHKDVYLFALDKFSDPKSQDPRLRDDPYEIDGEFFSGPTRFINHSCDPNLRIFAVVTDHANKPFHGLS
ncbi:Histone-lysine N-methyltransferase, H3 lysine-9 specific dim-5, partial [Cadophora sp. M221]